MRAAVMRNKPPIDDLRRRVLEASNRCDLDGLHEAVVAYYEGTGREPPPDSEEPSNTPERRTRPAAASENDCGND